MNTSVSHKNREKDSTAIVIGQRVKQARLMADFTTIKKLSEKLMSKYGWSTGRLGNYESGQSIAHPDDIEIIAKETKSSACWIMFGSGPIRATQRDLQAIRHQNLVHCYATLKEGDKAALDEFLEKSESNKSAITKFIDNPFRKIGLRQARRFEKALGRTKQWLDEQHIEIDPMGQNFPEDLREIMSMYSDLDTPMREKLLNIIRAFSA